MGIVQLAFYSEFLGNDAVLLRHELGRERRVTLVRHVHRKEG
ncbi:hypothetical protein LINPERHAP2_LOCUS30796 [Linum perenne]